MKKGEAEKIRSTCAKCKKRKNLKCPFYIFIGWGEVKRRTFFHWLLKKIPGKLGYFCKSAPLIERCLP